MWRPRTWLLVLLAADVACAERQRLLPVVMPEAPAEAESAIVVLRPRAGMNGALSIVGAALPLEETIELSEPAGAEAEVYVLYYPSGLEALGVPTGALTLSSEPGATGLPSPPVQVKVANIVAGSAGRWNDLGSTLPAPLGALRVQLGASRCIRLVDTPFRSAQVRGPVQILAPLDQESAFLGVGVNEESTLRYFRVTASGADEIVFPEPQGPLALYRRKDGELISIDAQRCLRRGTLPGGVPSFREIACNNTPASDALPLRLDGSPEGPLEVFIVDGLGGLERYEEGAGFSVVSPARYGFDADGARAQIIWRGPGVMSTMRSNRDRELTTFSGGALKTEAVAKSGAAELAGLAMIDGWGATVTTNEPFAYRASAGAWTTVESAPLLSRKFRYLASMDGGMLMAEHETGYLEQVLPSGHTCPNPPQIAAELNGLVAVGSGFLAIQSRSSTIGSESIIHALSRGP